MGSYYYVKDPNSEFGYTPIPEEEYIVAILRIVGKRGVKITDGMILEELGLAGNCGKHKLTRVERRSYGGIY